MSENFRSRHVEKKIEYVLKFLKIFRFLIWIAIVFFGLITAIMTLASVILHFPLENSIGYTRKDFYWTVATLLSACGTYFSLEKIFKNIEKIFINLKENPLFTKENVKIAYKIFVFGILYEFLTSFVLNIYSFIYEWDFSISNWVGVFFEFLNSVPEFVALFAIVWLFDLGTQIQSEIDEVI